MGIVICLDHHRRTKAAPEAGSRALDEGQVLDEVLEAVEAIERVGHTLVVADIPPGPKLNALRSLRTSMQALNMAIEDLKAS